jgi:hypothetical protein
MQDNLRFVLQNIDHHLLAIFELLFVWAMIKLSAWIFRSK